MQIPGHFRVALRVFPLAPNSSDKHWISLKSTRGRSTNYGCLGYLADLHFSSFMVGKGKVLSPKSTVGQYLYGSANGLSITSWTNVCRKAERSPGILKQRNFQAFWVSLVACLHLGECSASPCSTENSVVQVYTASYCTLSCSYSGQWRKIDLCLKGMYWYIAEGHGAPFSH